MIHRITSGHVMHGISAIVEIRVSCVLHFEQVHFGRGLKSSETNAPSCEGDNRIIAPHGRKSDESICLKCGWVLS